MKKYRILSIYDTDGFADDVIYLAQYRSWKTLFMWMSFINEHNFEPRIFNTEYDAQVFLDKYRKS